MPESFFNKAAGPRPSTLLKKRLWHRCFPVNVVYGEISKNTFFYKIPPVAASETYKKEFSLMFLSAVVIQ